MKKNNENAVSVRYNAYGEVDGILIKTIDESFVIDLFDAEGERQMTWDEAMGKYKDVLPSKRQALLICAYLDEINELLEEAGGKKLYGWYWTKAVSEYSARIAWMFNGNYGCVHNLSKYSVNGVRPVHASA